MGVQLPLFNENILCLIKPTTAVFEVGVVSGEVLMDLFDAFPIETQSSRCAQLVRLKNETGTCLAYDAHDVWTSQFVKFQFGDGE